MANHSGHKSQRLKFCISSGGKFPEHSSINVYQGPSLKKNYIVSVKVEINKEDWILCTKFSQNVYTALKDPFDYVGGPNILNVEVSDNFEDKEIISQQFVVKNTKFQYEIQITSDE